MRLIVLLLGTLLFACSSSDTPAANTVCYIFNERQCGGDPWLEEIGTNISDDIRAAELRSYLESQSVAIQGVQILSNPDLITCQACFVCPTGTSYLIEVDTTMSPEIESLDLLGLQEVACSQ